MLIYFEKQKVAINMQNVVSIGYNNPSYSLYFNVNIQMKDVEIFFPTKDDALKALDTILTAYSSHPQKVLVIHTDK